MRTGDKIRRGNTLSPLARLFLGVAFCALGIEGVLDAFGLGVLPRADFYYNYYPLWMHWTVGAMLVVLGLVILIGRPAEKLFLGPSHTALVTVAVGIAAIPNWIAFGPGERDCGNGFSSYLLGSQEWAIDLECRIAFGIGATIINGALLLAMAHVFSKRFGDGMFLQGLDRAGKIILVAGMLPFLLPAALLWLLLGRSGRQSDRGRKGSE